MKKFWKSLALLLCLLAGFGFVVTGCSDGDDGNGGDTAKIALSKEAVTLQPGGSVTLTLNKGSTPITSGVTWSVDDPTVANVNASDTCVATVSPKDGVSSGSTDLIATYESKKYTAKITVSDISLPITIEFSSSFVNDEFGALTPSQSKETYAGSGLNTWDTGTAEVRTTTGMYVLANASGLIKNPREGDKFITYYYGSGGSAAAAVGGTLPAAGLKSYLAFSAAQVKTDKASVKVTINAHGVDYDHAKDAAEAGKYGTIGIVDSSNNKVLAVSETLTAEAKDYVFYVKPSTRLVITNVGKDGTSISFNKMTLEASDNAVTATGSIAVESITLNTATLSGTAGGSAELTATVSPATATDVSLTWASSDPAVAKVTPATDTLSATVEYVAAGSATITVSMGSVKQEATVTVTAAGKPITAIDISGNAAIDLFNNDNPTTTLTATVTPTDTDVTSLSWSSSDPAIAKVASASTDITSGTSSVVVTAAGKVGTAKITAKAGSVEKTFDVVVSASGASWKTYKVRDEALANNYEDGTFADGTVTWSGLVANGDWAKFGSADAYVAVKVKGPSVVTLLTYDGCSGMSVVDSSNNSLVDNLTLGTTSLSVLHSEDVATTLTFKVGNGKYIKNLTVEDGTGKLNVANRITIGDSSTVSSGTPLSLTAVIQPKYINTDKNALSGSASWKSSSTNVATVTESSSIVYSGGKYTSSATVTYVSDGKTNISVTIGNVTSDDYPVTASSVASTIVSSSWDFTGTITKTTNSLYTDAALTTLSSNQERFSNKDGYDHVGYIKGTNSVALYVDASDTTGNGVDSSNGAYFKLTGTYAETGAGVIFRIPVSAGSVVTITHWDAGAAASFTLAGKTCNAVTSTYTATSDGYCELKGIAKKYFKSISVTNVDTSKDHSTANSNGECTGVATVD